MRNLILLAVICLSAVGCASSIAPGGTARVDTDVRFLDYNEIHDQYAERPTSVTVNQQRNGNLFLKFQIDLYGQDLTLWVPQSSVDPFLAALDKFLEWEALASERGDLLDKDIGRVPGYSGLRIETAFYSGTKERHYMSLEQCSLVCPGPFVYLNRSQAENVKGLLNRFAAGEITPANTDSVYN